MKDHKDNVGIQDPNSKTRIQGSGTLYIVSTPIGNLEDITLRALRVLRSVNLIAAESVKHSKGLCRHYDIKTRLTSYNQHNQKFKGPEIIRKLKSGWDVAYITNAGTPGVSDPGAMLIHQAIDQKIKISPIPGPSAVTAALSVSGLRSDSFLFLGFLSNKAGRRRKELKALVSEPRAVVFFEAPHRLQAMLKDIKELMGDREIVLLRELTKVYEEIRRGSVSAVLEDLEPHKIKGEFTLVVAGSKKGVNDDSLDKETLRKIEKLLKEEGMRLKDIATKLSLEEGVDAKKIYKASLSIKRRIQRSNQES